MKKVNSINIIYFIVLLILSLSKTEFSQSVKVVNLLNQPIEGAVITGGNKRAVTNKDGGFNLTPFLNIDSIKVRHLAYKHRKVSVKKLNIEKKIVLIRKDFTTKEIKVTSENLLTTSESVDITPLVKAEFADAAELLNKRTTLLIKDYGNGVGLKTVSARGMSSDNTLVLFNEAMVNDLRSGSFDLSQIGLNSLDKVQYFKNNSDGYSAVGGVLKLTSGKIHSISSFLIGAKIDNLRGNNYYGKINIAAEATTYSFNFERAYSPNNYQFIFEGNSIKRLNADYSKFFISNSINHLYKNGFLKFYFHYSTISNGLPGFVVSNNYSSSIARSSNKSILSVVNYLHQFSAATIYRSTVSFNRQKIKMFDPRNELFSNQTETQNSLSEAGFNNYLDTKLLNADLKLGFQFTYSEMTSTFPSYTETAENNLTYRYSEKVFAGATKKISIPHLFSMFRINANGALTSNQETTPLGKTTNVFSNYKVGIGFSPKFDENFTINLYYAGNFREPTFTEIFYSKLFSTQQIKGEKYYSFNLSAGYSFSRNTSANLSLYSIIGKDKIVWLPTRLAFQIPRNFKSIKSNGIELLLNSSPIPNILSFNLIYVYNKSINSYFSGIGDNSYNKQLIYSPQNRINLSTRINLSYFEISSDFSFVDKRYYTADNNPRFTLPAYYLLDISISKMFSFSNAKIRTTLKVYNLTNQNYFIIQSYPMPLRTVMFDVQTEIK